jgi:hypothetical protein
MRQTLGLNPYQRNEVLTREKARVKDQILKFRNEKASKEKIGNLALEMEEDENTIFIKGDLLSKRSDEHEQMDTHGR